MQVVVPFSATDPKTRLADVLAPDERREFSLAMLEDVLSAIRATGREPRVLTTSSIDVDAPQTVDSRPLTPAVNDVLAEQKDTAIVMADLALATPDTLERLFSTPDDVVLAPGRGGGTNALVSRHPDFRVDYHGTSYLDHLRIAGDVRASVTEVDSHRLATDVDESSDLAEVLIHSDGSACQWLREAGFSLSVTEGRVEASRDGKG
ncbi:phospholactate guanylyltransferase [Haladaptatus litoreus]|uniref:2-phospho-L-lactate guanylyltransferase n=1 Tax=Haladaptatus litoreus TaxID=553468 RepID=A0A1N7B5E6_9EURY|nr:2-phospho-L-lactate guanylyltransferase [Haladaptatus litoreus]SIR46569.1 phospholactate guanylyltransferase [Haladaptatus litoreus]